MNYCVYFAKLLSLIIIAKVA